MDKKLNKNKTITSNTANNVTKPVKQKRARSIWLKVK